MERAQIIITAISILGNRSSQIKMVTKKRIFAQIEEFTISPEQVQSVRKYTHRRD